MDDVIDRICDEFSEAASSDIEALRPILELNLGIALLAIFKEAESLRIQLESAKACQQTLKDKLQSLQETLDAYQARVLPS